MMQANLSADSPLFVGAINTAVYLYNVFPSAANLALAPWQILHGKEWDRCYAHLHPFGCLAYVHITTEERQQQAQRNTLFAKARSHARLAFLQAM